MKLVFCDPEGKVEKEGAATRLPDLSKFYKTEGDGRVLAETTDAVIQAVPTCRSILTRSDMSLRSPD